MNKITKGIIALIVVIGVVSVAMVLKSSNAENAVVVENKQVQQEEIKKVDEVKEESGEEKELTDEERKQMVEDKMAAVQALVQKLNSGEISKEEFDREIAELGVTTQKKN